MSNRATGVGQSAFKGLKTPRAILQYNLMRGVTDFSNLEQYDLYEKGYPFLICVKAPDFMMDLAKKDSEIDVLVKNYIHIIENDFRGIDNIDNITGEANGEITNGIRSIQIINKVTKPSNSTFTMRYYERSGSVLTKFNELYLTGIKDPDTEAKHYHGLIDDAIFGNGTSQSGNDPGPHRECFTFLYFVTDNTMSKIEKAFLIAAAQPNIADFGTVYTSDKGQIEFTELSMTFNGFFINNDMVYMKAQKALLAMRNPANLTGSRIIVDSNNFTYKSINDVNVGDENSDDAWWDKNGSVDPKEVSGYGNKTGSADLPATGENSYSDSVAKLGKYEHFVPYDSSKDNI